MSARRGAQLVPIGIPIICWTFAEKKPQENKVHQKLKHLDDVIFRVLAFGVGVIKMNYFSMSLLKIETKTYQFCFEMKYHGILNERRLNLSRLLINTAKNRNGISPDQFHQALP